MDPEIRRIARELGLDPDEEWEFLSERALLCVDDYHEPNPNTRVACLPKDPKDDPLREHSYSLGEAVDYFERVYATGRVGLMFETARYYCQRVRKSD